MYQGQSALREALREASESMVSTRVVEKMGEKGKEITYIIVYMLHHPIACPGINSRPEITKKDPTKHAWLPSEGPFF
jgi:hypothetical protein